MDNHDYEEYIDPRVVIDKFTMITGGYSLRSAEKRTGIKYSSIRDIYMGNGIKLETYMKVLRYVLRYEKGINLP
jgi:hypothetical protein